MLPSITTTTKGFAMRYTVRILGQSSYSSVATIEEAIADARDLRGMVWSGEVIVYDNLADEIVCRF